MPCHGFGHINDMYFYLRVSRTIIIIKKWTVCDWTEHMSVCVNKH